MQALNAPAIAGQEGWYLTRQLKNFKSGIRGAHPKDIYGAQMRPMAMTLAGDQAMSDVVAYITSLPAPPREEGVSGNPETGQQTYATCAACHGAKGEGNRALNAPKLTGLPSWYIKRQLEHFKAGIRGGDPKDTYGMQMKPMAMTIPDGQVDNLIAYIKSL
jgi:cytochrome c oxidase subunit 2